MILSRFRWYRRARGGYWAQVTSPSTTDKTVFVRFDRHVKKFGWDGATSQGCDPNDLHTLP